MATITASLVNELRSKTGLAMMKCKEYLVKTEGNLEAAFDMARKEGVKDSITARAATEGRVEVATFGDVAAVVEVVCNTDFTAKSDEVLKLAEHAAKLLAGNQSVNVADDAEIKDALANVSKVTGENVQLGRSATVKGNVGSYLYSTAGKGKIGVLVEFSAPPADDLVRALGMHIAAARPVALSRADVPAEVIAKEKEIAIEQAKATGKPQEIAEKIAEGKMSSFYSERVLLDQDFINADFFKGKVSALLKSKGVELKKYVRLEVGQA